MNIFVLDKDPEKAAWYHCDKHVNKMIVETAQLLSTAHHVASLDDSIKPFIYKQTHTNHPCSIWVRESTDNYLWTYELFFHLSEQYRLRYHKLHRTYLKLYKRLYRVPDAIESIPMTPFAQVMPEAYRNLLDPVKAYRRYYMDKLSIASWSFPATIPEWMF